MEEKKYGVWAVRSAVSMFGAAEAWCKADGVPMEFDSLNAARLYANHLNETVGSPNVHYYPKEMQPKRRKKLKNPVHNPYGISAFGESVAATVGGDLRGLGNRPQQAFTEGTRSEPPVKYANLYKFALLANFVPSLI